MVDSPSDRSPFLRRRVTLPALSVAAVALLAVPAGKPDVPAAPGGGAPFSWNRDSLWRTHESAFVASRAAACADSTESGSDLAALRTVITALHQVPVLATAPVLDSVEARLFAVTADVAACPVSLDDFLDLQVAHGQMIKWQSRQWDMTDRAVRERLYQALYGSRAAVEEVLLQHPDRIRALQRMEDEPSGAPSAVVQGVRLHSGDILVSRGGYPTSALIARGSDFPGNFSHVALVHVDSATHQVSVIEAHIAGGVAIATADAYLADKKLRVMVLRLRADLPALRRDPLVPHRAATMMRDRALREHIPYDFAMDYHDPTRLFCSEVASAAYAEQGVTLWAGISTITRPGLRRWLAGFGVRHFETQEPSDLEYDPQLVVVAEWRDPTELFRDHVANAVTDAMLEQADRGATLAYAWHELPVARVAKGYSIAAHAVGKTGPIPTGMSASAALRNRAYSAWHAALMDTVLTQAERWRSDNGHAPAYWTLVALARTAATR